MLLDYLCKTTIELIYIFIVSMYSFKGSFNKLRSKLNEFVGSF